MDLSSYRFAKTHEWVNIEGDIAVVGITDHAQDALGDLTFVELPEIDKKVSKGEDCAVVESVKAASDIYSPISGTIIEINEQLETEPELINKSPYEKGWIFKLKDFDNSEFESLMTYDEYQQFLENE